MYFKYLFWRATVDDVAISFCYCRPFMIFEGCRSAEASGRINNLANHHSMNEFKYDSTKHTRYV